MQNQNNELSEFLAAFRTFMNRPEPIPDEFFLQNSSPYFAWLREQEEKDETAAESK